MKCANAQMYGSANQDQGCFSTAIVWDVSTLIKIPDEIASEHAGPLMCGGTTVWGPLYEHGMRAGDRIGIVGFGGLGHMAIQFVAKMGMEAVVFSRTDSKKEEAFRFGASEFHTTKDVKEFKEVKPIDHLLITTSVLPDLTL
jgi:D-arabinose 1-dehydrogenase-like Zn-dependent alcohol dehydrogenase